MYIGAEDAEQTEFHVAFHPLKDSARLKVPLNSKIRS